ncbi:uncharacterized protein LOC117521611 isoform X2 [Thalassophryne amazonica]|uniref:uncharacterized protein LOC117521611 isoform X2 n=1 Tax=Thalassophryne amazonica TaxID=390379 RepID=UPI0014723DB5|nr:uncharacterized protein LOC117521611 isoform X2 [Thalassophryne amazonica]
MRFTVSTLSRFTGSKPSRYTTAMPTRGLWKGRGKGRSSDNEEQPRPEERQEDQPRSPSPPLSPDILSGSPARSTTPAVSSEEGEEIDVRGRRKKGTLDEFLLRFTEKELDRLLEWWRDNPCLFDNTRGDFLDSKKKQRLREEMAARIGRGCTEKDIQRKMNTLRTQVGNIYRETGPSGQGVDGVVDPAKLVGKKKWVWERLAFLLPYIRTKETRSTAQGRLSSVVMRQWRTQINKNKQRVPQFGDEDDVDEAGDGGPSTCSEELSTSGDGPSTAASIGSLKTSNSNFSLKPAMKKPKTTNKMDRMQAMLDNNKLLFEKISQMSSRIEQPPPPATLAPEMKDPFFALLKQKLDRLPDVRRNVVQDYFLRVVIDEVHLHENQQPYQPPTATAQWRPTHPYQQLQPYFNQQPSYQATSHPSSLASYPQQTYISAAQQSSFASPTPQQPFITPTPQQPFPTPTPQQPFTVLQQPFSNPPSQQTLTTLPSQGNLTQQLQSPVIPATPATSTAQDAPSTLQTECCVSAGPSATSLLAREITLSQRTSAASSATDIYM